jgi:PTS system ascorbate-specific IIA component
MIGIVLIAHQPLASALATSASHVYECAPAMASEQLAVLDVLPAADLDETVAQARTLAAGVDSGDGVVVLTDAFGATPGNVATALAEPGRVAVVAGVNLPMLLRTLCYREGALAVTVEKALSGGTQGVMQVAATPVQSPQNRSPANDQSQLHHQQ